jgi:hypothetical protein
LHEYIQNLQRIQNTVERLQSTPSGTEVTKMH